MALLPEYARAHLCQCKSCGLVFCERIPSLEELTQIYEGYGRRDYLSPLTTKRYGELLDAFEPYRKTNRILDVGCGIGYFLEVAKQRGWDVYGTEFTNRAVQICRNKGICVVKGALNPARFDVDFDVITSFEVLEHINNPREEIQYFSELLRSGGLVYLTTPNFNSLLRYALKARYNVISYPEHLCYYTPTTVERLFGHLGFRRLKVESTGLSLTRLKTSIALSKESFVSATSSDELIRKRLESGRLLPLIKTGLNSVLTLIGKGDTLKCWFAKV